jgi:hypothetical protein
MRRFVNLAPLCRHHHQVKQTPGWPTAPRFPREAGPLVMLTWIAGVCRRRRAADLSQSALFIYPGNMQRYGIQAWWPS